MQFRIDARLVREVGDDTTRITAYFWSESLILSEGQGIDFDAIVNDFNSQLDNFNSRGSGFCLERLTRCVVSVVKFRPLAGNSYIPTPDWLKKKKCVLNVQNFDDEECFKWSILAHLMKTQHKRQRVSQYKIYENILNFANIRFPVQPVDIGRFEQQNVHISVNVLSYDCESKGFCVVYLSRHISRPHHVNLLLLEDETTSKRHYVLVENMSRLVSHRTKHNGKTFVCNSCLHPFSTRQSLDNHIPYCFHHPAQHVVYPDPENPNDCVLKFTSWNKQHPVPFYLVCDLECFLVPEEDGEEDEGKSVRVLNNHVVSGFACYRVTHYEQYKSPPIVYSGPDPMTRFYEHIMAESKLISNIICKNVSMRPLTPQQEVEYCNATVCGNCNETFTLENHKVRHHDHINGFYLFAACNRCNLQLKPTKDRRAGAKHKSSSTSEQAADSYGENFFLPVLFHNGKNYDAHFVLKHFERKWVEHRDKKDNISFDDVHIIPQNNEKYLQFQIGNVRFLDSYQFLSASLDELVTLLLKGGKSAFTHTRKHLKTDDDFIFAKQIYPYSYMTSREKFSETSLPPIEAFYDALRQEELEQKDYERAKQTWSQFKITNMQQYHDHYLLSDVLLLTDVFENFRRSVMNKHKLDCLHFVTLPSLSWAMALKQTGAELDLITDPDAYLMLENSMRGGIASISQRYAAANNPFVDGYDEDETRRYITYLDANSLYATAQSEALPVGNFRFLTHDEIEKFDLTSIKADADVGYILECDLVYPTHLHDNQNDYPLAPEHLAVTYDMLSPYAKRLIHPKRPWKPTKKLIPNLMDKSNYVCHYRNLQLYVKYGLVIAKIHRILSFSQKPWLRSWIETCNEQRRSAGSEFESDLAKLQANATFGKTLEQVRNRVNVRLIADEKKLLRAVAKVSFRRSEIVNENLVIVRSARTKIKLNKPIAVGFTILELSKNIMYEFYYGYLKAKYHERCSLLFTDTDSLCCEIRTHDLYQDMAENAQLFDTSNFEPDHALFSAANRRVLGKFKSETGSLAPKEFVGLRAKMYSLDCDKQSQKKAKGIPKYYVKKRLRHSKYLKVLRKVGKTTTSKFRMFRSTNHSVNTIEMSKLCLCAFDDKRFILEDGVHTLAYGHYSLRK